MSSVNVIDRPFKAWLSAARPRTLFLALAAIGMGSFLAAAAGSLNWAVALLALLTAVGLQILSNLANDYGDSLHGADSDMREGPQRAVQAGHISPGAMRRAMALAALLTMAAGLALVWLAFGAEGILLVILFLALGLAAVWAAVAYTAGSKPYGYAGLGDLAVFVFFGWVGVVGPYVLQTGQLDWAVFLPATSCGLFAVAVLNINNIRDIQSDSRAGKHSIPVRLGAHKARLYHWLLLVGGGLMAVVYVLLAFRSPWQFLFLLSVPLLLRNGLTVWRARTAAALDPMLKQMSLTTLFFVLTFGVGQLLG